MRERARNAGENEEEPKNKLRWFRRSERDWESQTEIERARQRLRETSPDPLRETSPVPEREIQRERSRSRSRELERFWERFWELSLVVVTVTTLVFRVQYARQTKALCETNNWVHMGVIRESLCLTPSFVQYLVLNKEPLNKFFIQLPDNQFTRSKSTCIGNSLGQTHSPWHPPPYHHIRNPISWEEQAMQSAQAGEKVSFKPARERCKEG